MISKLKKSGSGLLSLLRLFFSTAFQPPPAVANAENVTKNRISTYKKKEIMMRII